jgi:hypothetical protein
VSCLGAAGIQGEQFIKHDQRKNLKVAVENIDQLIQWKNLIHWTTLYHSYLISNEMIVSRILTFQLNGFNWTKK